MLIGVIEALQNDDLRLDIQESIQYLLIDEFQDSNNAQIELMHLLIDNPYISKPNIMVVGDPNQTIYGFNGAMLDNITDFQEHYHDGLTTIDLSRNYRSSQIILDEARDIITPYTWFHPALSAQQDRPNHPVSYTAFPTDADQAVSICKQILAWQKLPEKPSIAVLARSHKSLTYLAHYLNEHNISTNYEQNIDMRLTSCNQLIVSALATINALIIGDKQAANYHLSVLVRHPMFDIDSSVIWSIAVQARKNGDWYTALSQNSATSALTDWLDQLTSVATSQPLNSLIEQLLSREFATNKTLYQSFYKSPHGKGPDETMLIEAQATTRLLTLAKQYTQTDNVSLSSFLAMVMSSADRLFRFSPDTGQYSNAVTLMSVHGAKGLEFDHVMLIDCNEANWKPKASKYPTPLSLPIHINLDTAADYARLMYVAMTRAKQTLAISYASRIDAKTVALPAEQLTNKQFESAPPATITQKAIVEATQLVPPRPPLKTMRELLSHTLANYKISATTLSSFLDLSRSGMDTFIEEHLLKLPQPVSEVLAHGNAMHAAMELAQIQATNQKPNLAAIKRLYRHRLAEENLPEPTFQRLMGKADKQLDELFGALGLEFSLTSKPEQNASAFVANHVGIYGKIDRIDIVNDKTVRIVDYKTGKPITNTTSKSQATLLKQWRHKLQLGFYALLLKQDKNYANKTLQTRIIQLDATSPEHLNLDYDLSEQDLDHIKQLVIAVHKRIVNLDIPDASSFEPSLAGIQQFESWLIEQP